MSSTVLRSRSGALTSVTSQCRSPPSPPQELPENELYCPPITIRCVDFRNFGRYILVGTHVIDNIHKFMYIPVTKTSKEAMKRFLNSESPTDDVRTAVFPRSPTQLPSQRNPRRVRPLNLPFQFNSSRNVYLTSGINYNLIYAD